MINLSQIIFIEYIFFLEFLCFGERLTFATVEFNVQRYNDHKILFFGSAAVDSSLSTSTSLPTAAVAAASSGHPSSFTFKLLNGKHTYAREKERRPKALLSYIECLSVYVCEACLLLRCLPAVVAAAVVVRRVYMCISKQCQLT